MFLFSKSEGGVNLEYCCPNWEEAFIINLDLSITVGKNVKTRSELNSLSHLELVRLMEGNMDTTKNSRIA